MSDESHVHADVDPPLDGQRLDVAVSQLFDLSRSHAAKLIKDGQVQVNRTPTTRPSTKVAKGDRLTAHLPPAHEDALDLTPEARPLEILFESGDVLVVNKPSQMVIHPSASHPRGTLVHTLLHYAPEIKGLGETYRPGIVHRIDKETSGVMAIARSPRAFEALQAAFAAQRPERTYLALAAHMHGEGLDDAGTIETLHGRSPTDRRRFTGTEGTRTAITHYRVLERFAGGAMLVECRLQTGRTHQIRMHLRECGVPILGDDLYGPHTRDRFPIIDRTALHATSLRIELPWAEPQTFHAPPPEDFMRALEQLRQGPPYAPA